MKDRSFIEAKPPVDFNQKDVLNASGLILAAGVLFFATSFALFWVGSHSLVNPAITVGAGALLIGLAFAVGMKLYEWKNRLTENTRRLAFIMGIIPWNLALLGSYILLNMGPQMDQVQALDTSAWSDRVRFQVQHLINIELALPAEKALFARVLLTSGVALVMGIALMVMRRYPGMAHSGALLVSVGVGTVVFIIGRCSAVITAVLEGFARIGAI